MVTLRELVVAGAALALLPLAPRAQDDAGVLIVYVEGIETADGQILVELFESADAFMSEPAFSEALTAEEDADFRVRFENVPPGEYAVFAWHDVDGDGELRRGVFMGGPKEPVGFSNDARFDFAPPQFAEAAFRIDTGLNEVIIRF